MNYGALHGRQLLAAAVFVAAVLVLAVQLITPSPVVVSVGGDAAEATQLGQYFTYTDVAIVATAACLLGSSGTYVLLGGPNRASAPAGRARGDSVGESARDAAETGGRTTDVPEGETGTPDREDWEDVADRLTDNESVVFEALLDADGEIPQRTIVEETDFSKATVSRTLDTLETRGLVERKRRGMGNVITLRDRDETAFTRV